MEACNSCNRGENYCKNKCPVGKEIQRAAMDKLRAKSDMVQGGYSMKKAMNRRMLDIDSKEVLASEMDEVMIDLCKAMNCLAGVRTTDSCCGHGDGGPWVFFECTDSQSLFFLARCVDRMHFRHSWRIEVGITDTNESRLKYWLRGESVGEYGEISDLIDNMNDHLNNEKFLKLFKIRLSKFKYIEDNQPPKNEGNPEVLAFCLGLGDRIYKVIQKNSAHGKAHPTSCHNAGGRILYGILCELMEREIEKMAEGAWSRERIDHAKYELGFDLMGLKSEVMAKQIAKRFTSYVDFINFVKVNYGGRSFSTVLKQVLEED